MPTIRDVARMAGVSVSTVSLADEIVVLDKGSGKIVYRISDRRPMQANVNYYLCPDGHSVCQTPRS